MIQVSNNKQHMLSFHFESPASKETRIFGPQFFHPSLFLSQNLWKKTDKFAKIFPLNDVMNVDHLARLAKTLSS